MRKFAFFAILTGLIMAGGIRHFFDNVGFCTKPYQIETIVKLSEKLEPGASKIRGNYFAVISPHDDHIYAGRVYIYAMPRVAGAKTVVIFAVTHHRARMLLKDPHGIIILDDYDRWDGPYGPVEVDRGFRQYIKTHLPSQYYMISNEAQKIEHSAEAMVPFLQYYNRKVRILSIMVTGMNYWRMKEVSEKLAAVLYSYMKEKGLKPGKDISFIISADNTHYGPDFNYSVFGLDEEAHRKATAQDRELGEKFLSGLITEDKIRAFADRVWGEEIPWCGRYSVPFGLLTLRKMAELMGRKMEGIAFRYGDSYSLGVLPAFRLGIGTTAPFSLKHWVGYWAIGYRLIK